MKKSNFTESKIISILKQQETGRTIAEISREYGISQATFFNWKNKYGGMNLPAKKIKGTRRREPKVEKYVR